jgi:predicted CoA-binding protein
MDRPTIAIVGASSDRRKFGNKAVRAYLEQGYDVFPIHPTAPTIEGQKTYASVAEVPVPRLDRLSVYLPPDVCLPLLGDLARKPAQEVWFNPGADRLDVLDKARALGLKVVAGCSIVDIGVSPSEFAD